MIERGLVVLVTYSSFCKRVLKADIVKAMCVNRC